MVERLHARRRDHRGVGPALRLRFLPLRGGQLRLELFRALEQRQAGVQVPDGLGEARGLARRLAVEVLADEGDLGELFLRERGWGQLQLQ